MPTPYELSLLEMSRKANAEPAPTNQLPDLDPRMFLGDFEGLPLPPQPQPGPDITQRHARYIAEQIAEHQDQVVASVLALPPDPGSLFMASALREIGLSPEDLAGFNTTATEPGFNIEYDQDFDVDTVGRGVPNEAVRFQVGRETPRAPVFSARQERTDGEVVARVGQGGRFEAIPQQRHIPYGAAQVRQMSAQEARVVRPAYVPVVAADTSPAPAQSVLDIVSGNSLDDI